MSNEIENHLLLFYLDVMVKTIVGIIQMKMIVKQCPQMEPVSQTNLNVIIVNAFSNPSNVMDNQIVKMALMKLDVVCLL